MSRRSNAVIWNYFQKFDMINKIATCNFCKKNLSYKSTTTNLRIHLKLKHVSVYCEFIGSLSLVSQNQLVSLHDNSGGGSGTGNVGGGPVTFSNTVQVNCDVLAGSSTTSITSVANENQLHRKRQMNMTSYSIPKKLRPIDKQHIDKCLVKMIAYDFQPFSIVQDIGFRAYTHALNPNYELPDRKTISNVLLPMFYEERLQFIKKYVTSNAVSVCLTADSWSSKSMDHYMAVTAHFLTDNMEYKSVLLKCTFVEGRQTGYCISEEIKSIVEEWNLQQSVNFFVTDNASNMKVAAEMLKWTHFGCYAHKLNLIVQNGLLTIKSTLDKVSRIVAHFKKSIIAKERLHKYQILNQNITVPYTLIKSVPTRWNSTYLMLERFLVLEEALKATIPLLSVDLPVITHDDWKCIKQAINILKPFYEATKIVSGENYLTASISLVMTNNLLSICDAHISDSSASESIRVLSQKLKEGISNRLGDIENVYEIALCTILDPRFKEDAFQNTNALQNTKSSLIEMMTTYYSEDSSDSAVVTAASSASSSSSDLPSLSVWGIFAAGNILAKKLPKTPRAKAEEELQLYLKENLLSVGECPLEWWRSRKAIYPVLYKILKIKGNIMVTSVPCERAFSKAGYIISDRRTRLTTTKITQLMFLNANKINQSQGQGVQTPTKLNMSTVPRQSLRRDLAMGTPGSPHLDFMRQSPYPSSPRDDPFILSHSSPRGSAAGAYLSKLELVGRCLQRATRDTHATHATHERHVP